MPSIFKIAGQNWHSAGVVRIGGGLVSVIMPESAWQREQAARRRQEEQRRRARSSVVGSFGPNLVFEVGERKILTPKNWKRAQSSRWATHDILNAPPRSEFQGPDRLETTMTVDLSAEHGVKPKKTMELIEQMIRRGDVEYLVLGGQIYGWNAHKFLIESSSTAYNTVYNRGELVRCSVDITFKEYW